MAAMVFIQLDLFGDHVRIIPGQPKKRKQRRKAENVENKIYALRTSNNAPQLLDVSEKRA